jgi:predicted DNA binding CopG/RHH family protein
MLKQPSRKKTMNIRIIERDHKQYRPLTDGIPYQTLIAS